jgi:hypothetical protein
MQGHQCIFQFLYDFEVFPGQWEREEYLLPQWPQTADLTLVFFFLVLELELRAFTLSHSTSPFFCDFFFFFEIGSLKLFAWSGFEPHLPDPCLLSSKGYRREPLALALTLVL